MIWRHEKVSYKLAWVVGLSEQAYPIPVTFAKLRKKEMLNTAHLRVGQSATG